MNFAFNRNSMFGRVGANPEKRTPRCKNGESGGSPPAAASVVDDGKIQRRQISGIRVWLLVILFLEINAAQLVFLNQMQTQLNELSQKLNENSSRRVMTPFPVFQNAPWQYPKSSGEQSEPEPDIPQEEPEEI